MKKEKSFLPIPNKVASLSKGIKAHFAVSKLTDRHTTQPQTLEFLSLRKYSPKIQLGIIEKAIYYTDGLGLVIIDGVGTWRMTSTAHLKQLI
jgi:hypothetical protein